MDNTHQLYRFPFGIHFYYLLPILYTLRPLAPRNEWTRPMMRKAFLSAAIPRHLPRVRIAAIQPTLCVGLFNCAGHSAALGKMELDVDYELWLAAERTKAAVAAAAHHQRQIDRMIGCSAGLNARNASDESSHRKAMSFFCVFCGQPQPLGCGWYACFRRGWWQKMLEGHRWHSGYYWRMDRIVRFRGAVIRLSFRLAPSFGGKGEALKTATHFPILIKSLTQSV